MNENKIYAKKQQKNTNIKINFAGNKSRNKKSLYLKEILNNHNFEISKENINTKKLLNNLINNSFKVNLTFGNNKNTSFQNQNSSLNKTKKEYDQDFIRRFKHFTLINKKGKKINNTSGKQELLKFINSNNSCSINKSNINNKSRNIEKCINLKFNIAPKKINFSNYNTLQGNLTLNKSISKSKSKSQSKNKSLNKNHNRCNQNSLRIAIKKNIIPKKVNLKMKILTNNRKKSPNEKDKSFKTRNFKKPEVLGISLNGYENIHPFEKNQIKTPNLNQKLHDFKYFKQKSNYFGKTIKSIKTLKIDINPNIRKSINNCISISKLEGIKKYKTNNNSIYIKGKKKEQVYKNKFAELKEISLKFSENNNSTNQKEPTTKVNKIVRNKKLKPSLNDNKLYSLNNKINSQIKDLIKICHCQNIKNSYSENNNIPFQSNKRIKTENDNNKNEKNDNIFDENVKHQSSFDISNKNSCREFPYLYTRDEEDNSLKPTQNIENYINCETKTEKELDENESPIHSSKKFSDEKNEDNSGALTYDEVKDIIVYYDMKKIEKKEEYLFCKNENEIFTRNMKNKYFNIFFGINKPSSKVIRKKNIKVINEINNSNLKKKSESSNFYLETQYTTKIKAHNYTHFVKNT